METDFLKKKKSYFEKNVIQVTNNKRSVFSTDEKIPTLGNHYIYIQIY